MLQQRKGFGASETILLFEFTILVEHQCLEHQPILTNIVVESLRTSIFAGNQYKNN